MKSERPLLVLRPDGSIDSLVAALRRLNVSKRFNGRIIVEARAVGSPALERKLLSWDCHDEHVASAHQAAQRLTERLMEYSMRIGIEVRTRLTADEVSTAAKKHKADMVIISRSIPESRLSGIVPPFESRVCRLAPCPVWCASNRPVGPIVAVAVDPDASTDEERLHNARLVQHAARLALSATGSAELQLIGAWSIFGLTPSWWRRRDAATSELIRRTRQTAQKELHDLADRVYRSDLTVRTQLIEGAAPVAIQKALEETNSSLVVIGNRQRSGVQHALHANTVESVLKRASCSVLSVIQEELDEWSLINPEIKQPAERSSVNAVA
ncbi:MAG: universal stress protein [Planctomycetaceae bacterium]|nr:universal stress protein [Planctomycetaceae bacterium]